MTRSSWNQNRSIQSDQNEHFEPAKTAYFIGKKYQRAKKAVPNPEGAGGKSGKIVNAQNEQQQTTADKIAAEHGTSGVITFQG